MLSLSLKKAGLTDDTLIWYTSDNGPAGDDPDNVKKLFRGSTGGFRGRKAHPRGRYPCSGYHQVASRHDGGWCYPRHRLIRAGDWSRYLLDRTRRCRRQLLSIASSTASPFCRFSWENPERDRPCIVFNSKQTYRVAIRDGDLKLLCDSSRSTWTLYNLVDIQRK